MCYEVKCSGCGKVTWGGCGRHVPSVYKRIEEAQRCLCKEWPGVDLAGNGGSQTQTQTQPSSGSNSTIGRSNCNIL